MAKKSALGRGLDSLFLENSPPEASGTPSALPLSSIEPKSTQPRKDFDKSALEELSDSISRHGLIQPIVVRPLESGMYQIIAGERRWRASKMAGLNEVPVIIKDIDDLSAAELSLVENLQREDLNPVEEAMGYKYLSEEYGLTQEEISQRMNKSRPVVANALRLLSLPKEILKYLEQGQITTGHARTLLSVGDEDLELVLASRIIKSDLSVRETEKIVKGFKEKPAEKPERPKSPEEEYFISLERKISGIFGRSIHISQSKKDKASGKLEIEYLNNKELEELIRLLCGEEAFSE